MNSGEPPESGETLPAFQQKCKSNTFLRLARQNRAEPMTDNDIWTPPSASTASRLPPVRSSASSRGTILNHKSNRTIWYESSIERGAAYVFLARPDVQDIWDQPAPVTYVSADGRTRPHTFDFLVLLKNGTRVAVAVKPSEKAERITDTLERIANQSAVPFADRIALVTERDLPIWLVSNAELIHSATRERADNDDATVRNILEDVAGSVTIGSIATSSKLGGRALRSIARLLGTGDLTLAHRGRITRRSLVIKASPNPHTEGAR